MKVTLRRPACKGCALWTLHDVGPIVPVMKRIAPPLLIVAVAALAGCSETPFGEAQPTAEPVVLAEPDQTRPQARPAISPPANARTAEAFDTVSAEEKAAAVAVPAARTDQKIGMTVASLGDPTQPGLWLKTPLVNAPRKGRVVYPGSGKSAQVDLIPLDADAGAGSQISLSAMRLIEAPLTDLPEIEVFGS